MKVLFPAALALAVAACSSAALPELSPTDAASPDAPVVSVPYQTVMAGTAQHVPVGLKPWREVNDSVAPRGGLSP
jgi:hypothetical protein